MNYILLSRYDSYSQPQIKIVTDDTNQLVDYILRIPESKDEYQLESWGNGICYGTIPYQALHKIMYHVTRIISTNES